MRSADNKMNNCIRGYLTLDDIGDVVKYTEIDDDDEEGNTEGYINKLEFKVGDEFDLDEEWDNFCDYFFINRNNTGNNFYKDVDDRVVLAQEFNSKEMLWLLNKTYKYCIESFECNNPFYSHDVFEDEERIWNNIAYYWIRERSDVIKEFVLKKIEYRFDEWLEEQNNGVNHRLTCDICYEKKQIHTYASCCNDKKFCGGCYRKIKRNEDGKECPFCRGKLDLSLGDALLGLDLRTPFEPKVAWLESWKRKMNSIQAELLYNEGRCYEHHQDLNQVEMLCEKIRDDGEPCLEHCLVGYEYCRGCQEEELGMR
jgi:hypothetical protein